MLNMKFDSSSIVFISGIYRMDVPEACRKLVIVYLRPAVADLAGSVR